MLDFWTAVRPLLLLFLATSILYFRKEVRAKTEVASPPLPSFADSGSLGAVQHAKLFRITTDPICMWSWVPPGKGLRSFDLHALSRLTLPWEKWNNLCPPCLYYVLLTELRPWSKSRFNIGSDSRCSWWKESGFRFRCLCLYTNGLSSAYCMVPSQLQWLHSLHLYFLTCRYGTVKSHKILNQPKFLLCLCSVGYRKTGTEIHNRKCALGHP